jgi:hypothetical protein
VCKTCLFTESYKKKFQEEKKKKKKKEMSNFVLSDEERTPGGLYVL